MAIQATQIDSTRCFLEQQQRYDECWPNQTSLLFHGPDDIVLKITREWTLYLLLLLSLNLYLYLQMYLNRN